MSIVSLSFLVFLTVLVAAYFLLPKKCQWAVLLLGSVVFYVSAGGWFSLAFIYFTSFSIYLGARLISKHENKKKLILALDIIINLGILIVLKYGIFILKEVSGIVSFMGISLDIPERSWVLPLGISFYTLQAIGYLIDVYKEKEEAEKNFFKFALFVTFFPQLIQGPFSRYKQIGHQLLAEHKWDYTRVKYGIELMAWGYFMKLVIGDRAAVIVRAVVDGYDTYGHEGITILFAMMIYSIQIYADFSGGMNIVMGLSEILGINLPENFRQPFFAKSVAEFWRRWHITLGAWMKTYVFYPIALSGPFSKLGQRLRKKYGRTVGKVVPASIASFFVFFLVGMWHGADMKYVAYALYQAVLVSSNSLFEDVYKRMRTFFHVNESCFSWKAFQIVRTYILVLIGRYFSVANSLGDAINMLKRTPFACNFWVLWDGSLYDLGLNQRNFMVLIIASIVLGIVDILHEKGISVRKKLDESDIVLRWSIYFLLLFSIVIFGMYGAEVTVRDFIYQGF